MIPPVPSLLNISKQNTIALTTCIVSIRTHDYLQRFTVSNRNMGRLYYFNAKAHTINSKLCIMYVQKVTPSY